MALTGGRRSAVSDTRLRAYKACTCSSSGISTEISRDALRRVYSGRTTSTFVSICRRRTNGWGGAGPEGPAPEMAESALDGVADVFDGLAHLAAAFAQCLLRRSARLVDLAL